MTTLSSAVEKALTDRGLDVETAIRYGLHSQPANGGGDDALVLPFIRNGKVVRRKFRTFGAGKKFWQDKAAVRCAWNEDCLRDDSLKGQPVIIAEGELDALAALQAGFLRTISVPDGAPPATDADPTAAELRERSKYDWLNDIGDLLGKDRAPEIILAVDGDPNGAALSHQLQLLLEPYRCKFVVYPLAKNPDARGRPRLKDLNEVLEDYGERGVRQVIERAEWVRVDGVFKMSDLPPVPAPVVYDPGYRMLAENYRLRLGDTAVFTGIPSHGKSALVNDIVCRVVKGYGVRAAWASFEQKPQVDHKRNLRRWFLEGPVAEASASRLAGADEWIDEYHRLIVPKHDEDVTLDWMLDRLAVAAVQHKCRLLVIDPWNEMDHTRRQNESQTEYVGRAIKTLKRFADSFRVHLMIVAHPTKQTKDEQGNYRMPSLYDIADSAHWYNKPDVGVIVHRVDRDNTDIKVGKSRYHEEIGVPGTVRMQFSKVDGRFRETERID